MSNSYDINLKFVVRWHDFYPRQNQRESSRLVPLGGGVSGGNRTDRLWVSLQSELQTGEYIYCMHLFACAAAKQERSAEAGEFKESSLNTSAEEGS